MTTLEFKALSILGSELNAMFPEAKDNIVNIVKESGSSENFFDNHDFLTRGRDINVPFVETMPSGRNVLFTEKRLIGKKTESLGWFSSKTFYLYLYISD